MRFFPPELEVDLAEGFTTEKDIFGRKEFGERLIRIVRALEGPAVLLLDAPWGTGKTTFVKMWIGELNKAGIPAIYFDAFANDYHEDAFLAVAGEIIARWNDLQPRSRKALDKFKAVAVGVSKALGRAALRVGVRAASGGLLTGLEPEQGLERARAEGEEASKAIDELLKERLESHSADRRVFNEFRSALCNTAAALFDAARKQGANAGIDEHEDQEAKLIFVIDELDRCRPSFALELLEKIKHFFATDKLIFVLVASSAQLEETVRFAYGNIDARTYLEKFYHLRMLLPTGSTDKMDRGRLPFFDISSPI